MADRRKDDRRAEIHVDIGLGGLLKGLGDFLEVVSRLSESATERRGEAELPGGGKIVYGFSVKTALGGKPVVERFGNIKHTGSGPVVQETREPYIDVLDEEDEVVVIAELPGVEPEGIKLKVSGGVLSLKAETGDRKYAKEIPLPAPVDETALRHSYRNGVLEVRVKKR